MSSYKHIINENKHDAFKLYIDKNGDKRFKFQPGGVRFDEKDKFVSATIKGVANDRYFEEALRRKGPAAQVAWTIIYSVDPEYRNPFKRKDFLISSSWYAGMTEFRIVDTNDNSKHRGMLRISSHKPQDAAWRKYTQSDNVWCVNIMLGKETTTVGMKEFDPSKVIEFRYDTVEDFFNDKQMVKFVEAVARGNKENTITGSFEIGQYIFMRRRQKVIQYNKLKTGFYPDELYRLEPPLRRTDGLDRYNAGLYTEPSSNETYTIFFDKKPKPTEAFYLHKPYLGDRPGNRCPIKILGESSIMKEAVQHLPIMNADTQEYCISNVYSESELFNVGKFLLYDIIDQLDLDYLDEILDICTKMLPNEKRGKGFVYDAMKYYTDVERYIEDNDIDDVIRKYIIELGRVNLTEFLKHIDIDENGRVVVYKVIDITDLIKQTWDQNWCKWEYVKKDGNNCNQICNDCMMFCGTIDISEINWPRAVNSFCRNESDCNYLITNGLETLKINNVCLNGQVIEINKND